MSTHVARLRPESLTKAQSISAGAGCNDPPKLVVGLDFWGQVRSTSGSSAMRLPGWGWRGLEKSLCGERGELSRQSGLGGVGVREEIYSMWNVEILEKVLFDYFSISSKGGITVGTANRGLKVVIGRTRMLASTSTSTPTWKEQSGAT